VPLQESPRQGGQLFARKLALQVRPNVFFGGMAARAVLAIDV